MSLEAARNLSIPDLLSVLNEKLGLECTRLKETLLPCTVSATFLQSEVSEFRSTHFNKRGSGLTPAIRTDQKSRNQSTRSFGIDSLSAECIAAGKQVAARDPFSYRPRCSQR